MESKDRYCCLSLDEMAITSSYEYDASSKTVLGDVTLPNHSGQASHALVLMLGGRSFFWFSLYCNSIICRHPFMKKKHS